MARKPFPEGSVCKPCWELKYCPYGYLVEYSPLFHMGDGEEDFDTTQIYNKVLEELKEKGAHNEEDVHDYFQRLNILDPEANQYISQFEPEDIACRIFGHTCPVFFHQSGASETREPRHDGRHIPRKVMLQVVRRDGHICQNCRVNVPDDQIEFDHIIPFAKGGPTNVENLRFCVALAIEKNQIRLKSI